MEEPIISTTKEGENELQLNKDHAQVFRHPRYCSSRIRPPGPDRQHKVCDSQNVMNPLTQNNFEATFQQWQEHCYRCIAGQGDYLEGYGVQT
jgi:hypothetical protein